MDLEDPVQLNQEILTQKQDLFDLIMNGRHPTALPQKDKHAYDPNTDNVSSVSQTLDTSEKQNTKGSSIKPSPELKPNSKSVLKSNPVQ